MQPLLKRQQTLRQSIAHAYEQLAIDDKAAQAAAIEAELAAPENWSNWPP